MSAKDGLADEREEGEIIDEFEDIISSDEEFSMRQRIEELEAKNAELEKIENISGVYGSGGYDYMKKDSSSHLSDRYPLISIDISDDEEYPPAPPMSRITKRRKSLQHSCSRRKMIHTSSSSHRRRKKSSSPPPAPQYRQSDKILLSMFHERVAAHSSHSSKRKRKSKKSHSTKTSRRKSREYYISESDGDYNFDTYNVDVDDSYENFNSSDGDRNYSLNREELRVALARNTHSNEQHVSLKDRLIRRKENTDTLNEKTTPDPQEIVEEETKPSSYEENAETEDNLEEQELRIIALKSAVIRKHLVRKKRNENVAYSPSDFDEIYANITVSPPLNNIDDAEACNSMEISPVPSPKMILSDDEGMDTKPVDMDIVNSDSDCELPFYEKWVPIEQIPLPNNMRMGGGELYAPTPLRYNDIDERSVIPPEVRFESASVSPGNIDSEVEEEELALRALLLAKMNSPKVNKVVKEERPRVEETRTPDPDISLEAEALRNFLINNMKKKIEPKHSSASVLKEAVRRLTARNNSPAEGFTEIAAVKEEVKPTVKTAEETEMELGQAITEMARVTIGMESKVKPKPYVIIKRELLEDRADVEPNAIVKREVLEDIEACRNDVKADVEHTEVVNEKIVIKTELLDEVEVRVDDVDPNEIGEIDRSSEEPTIEEPRQNKELEVIPSEEVDKENKTGEASVSEDGIGVVVFTPQENKAQEKSISTNLEEVADTGGSSKTDRQLGTHTREEKVEDASTLLPQQIKTEVLLETISKPDEAITPLPGKEGGEIPALKLPEVRDKRETISKSAEESIKPRPEKNGDSTPQTKTKIVPSSVEEKKTVEIETSKSVVKCITSTSEKNGDSTPQIKSEVVPASVEQEKTVEIETSKSVVESITSTSEKNDDSTPQIKSSVEQEKTVEIETSKSVVESMTSIPERNGNSTCQIQTEIVSVTVETSKSVVKSITSTPEKSAENTLHIQTDIVTASVEQKKTVKVVPQSVSKVVEPKEITSALPSVTKIKVGKPDKPVSKKHSPPPKKSLPTAQVTQKPVSRQPTTSRTKIVKPNKVINHQTTDLKRKPVDVAKTSVPMKKMKSEDSSNRLITAAEIPQVKQLIIQLRASDTESEYSAMSADEYDNADGIDSRVGNFLDKSITIGNEYYDIASPISLPMESPCDTPTRTASPIVNVTPTPQPIVEKSIVNDFFEAKLDQFLKNVRSKVADSVKKPVQDNVATIAPVINTPVAVRHLPEASQQEYRRLINRMKMLERQKLAKNLEVIVNTNSGATTEGDNKTLARKVLLKNASANTAKPICDKKIVPQKPKTPEQKPIIKTATTKPVVVSPQKAILSLQKPVASPQKVVLPQPKLVPAEKPSEKNLLDLYENSYRKTGTSIISNLDKSIELVSVAKKAKMAKLRHEHRLRELQKEMYEVQRNLQQQQERITEIYPQICNSHQTIESLKTRRLKINKAVTALGRSVIGPNYSMNNDLKSVISEKSKKLAAEIKFVNNMKLSDVEKWENENHNISSDNATVVAAPKDLNSCLTVTQSHAIEKEMDPSSSIKQVPGGDSESPDTTTTAVNMSVPEDTQNMEPDLNDTIVPEEIISNKEDPNDSTNGHEEALESEPVVDKQTYNPEEVGETHEEGEEQVGGSKLQDYVSPLSHLRDERQINPNGIVCPYQLMGQCDDKDCKYMHLDE